MEIDKSGIRKVPVALNEQPDKTFYVEFQLEFEAKDESAAKAVVARMTGYLDANVTVTRTELSVEQDGVEGTVAIFTEEENDADAALRKLTENKGNKLWINYLQQQLKAAQGFKS